MKKIIINIKNLFKKKPIPSHNFNVGDMVMWEGKVLFVNDYYYDWEENQMYYTLYYPIMRMFYENVEEEIITRL